MTSLLSTWITNIKSYPTWQIAAIFRCSFGDSVNAQVTFVYCLDAPVFLQITLLIISWNMKKPCRKCYKTDLFHWRWQKSQVKLKVKRKGFIDIKMNIKEKLFAYRYQIWCYFWDCRDAYWFILCKNLFSYNDLNID